MEAIVKTPRIEIVRVRKAHKGDYTTRTQWVFLSLSLNCLLGSRVRCTKKLIRDRGVRVILCFLIHVMQVAREREREKESQDEEEEMTPHTIYIITRDKDLVCFVHPPLELCKDDGRERETHI